MERETETSTTGTRQPNVITVEIGSRGIPSRVKFFLVLMFLLTAITILTGYSDGPAVHVFRYIFPLIAASLASILMHMGAASDRPESATRRIRRASIRIERRNGDDEIVELDPSNIAEVERFLEVAKRR